MSAAHTPGPWAYQEGADAYTHIVRTGENRFLCQLGQDSSGEARANARLIAAAPDLLAALRVFLEAIPDETVHPGHYIGRERAAIINGAVLAAKAGIAKAEGRP